ncbi:M56 family metallopeptidase [Paenibacillus turicensis]|uniref:M56 family metallopeptidase n=1 Tax=Paenibacillus turicensis TaxID=160487 RepID=UPI003D26D3E0
MMALLDLLESAFATVLTHSLVSIIIVLVILLFRKALRVRINPIVMYAIWFLLLIKLLVPIAPASGWSLFNYLPQTISATINSDHNTMNKERIDQAEVGHSQVKTPSANSNPAESSLDNNTTDTTKATSTETSGANSNSNSTTPVGKKLSGISGLTLFSIVWLSGLVLLMIYYVLSSHHFRQAMKSSRKLGSPALTHILDQCKQQLGVKQSIGVYETSHLRSPCLYGLFKPNIYIPEDIVAIADTKQLTYIMLHELMHAKRKDLWVNQLWTIALGIHWFNPVIWYAVYKMRADQEIACDTGVLSKLEEEEVIHYGSTLLMMFRLFTSNAKPKVYLSSFFNRKPEMKRRVTMIANFKKGGYKLTALVIVAMIVLAASLLTSASDKQSKEEKKEVSSAEDKNIYLGPKDNPDVFGMYAGPLHGMGFKSLAQAEKYKQFDYKVPDYIPEGYRFEGINIGRQFTGLDNVIIGVNISFMTKRENNYQETFEIKAAIGEGTLLEHNELWGAPYERHSKSDIPLYKEIPVTISNITGVLYSELPATAKKRKNYKNGILRYSFVWQEQDVTYAINYSNNKENNATTNLEGVLSQSDLAKIVSSFVAPKQVQHVDYSGKGNSFIVYNTDDLNSARNILGFEAQLPLKIKQTPFELVHAFLLQKNDNARGIFYDYLGDALYSYYLIDPSNKPKEYDGNDSISLLQSNHPMFDTKELSFQRSLELDGQKISVYTDDKYFYSGIATASEGNKEMQTPTYFIWNQNDIYYTVSFTFFEPDVDYDALLQAVISSLQQEENI